MGGGSWSTSSWDSFSDSKIKTSRTPAGMYSSRNLDEALDPKKFDLREARDSSEHPLSTPIIIALDVTGSMDSVLDAMARNLNTLMGTIYERKPVSDPQICYMAIGDVECDDAPVQMTQFESDIRIGEAMTKVYVERGGGGNSYESYIAAWYMAAFKTVTDNWEKRHKKGILFTIGDENVTRRLSVSAIREFIDPNYSGQDITPKELYAIASEKWEIFHLVIKEGSYARSRSEEVMDGWRNIMGQRAMLITDFQKIPEVITSTLQVVAGEDAATVTASWDGTTALVVGEALKGLIKGKVDTEKGVVIFSK